ncbi:cupin domain [Sphingobium sp. AEW010]|nr:cupin domain [Sphingobium sp. AEW010]TWD15121.1 cupin domain [Sphingobium sp. AEW013]TWD19076.1 cupin domain [Sphingobium sp. AEW001]
MTLTLPPDSIYVDPAFDPMAAAAEHARNAPGLAELMEPSAPGFHTTETIDYVIVLDGEVVLEVDDDSTRLHPGDCVVQLGSRHAWRNPTDRPATLAVVMLGAPRG